MAKRDPGCGPCRVRVLLHPYDPEDRGLCDVTAYLEQSQFLNAAPPPPFGIRPAFDASRRRTSGIREVRRRNESNATPCGQALRGIEGVTFPSPCRQGCAVSEIKSLNQCFLKYLKGNKLIDSLESVPRITNLPVPVGSICRSLDCTALGTSPPCCRPPLAQDRPEAAPACMHKVDCIR